MILFRCDANPFLGLGHLMRCRALAAALTALGNKCVMVGPAVEFQSLNDANNFQHWIPFPWAQDAQADAAEIAKLASSFGASLVVLDDMRINEDYQRALLGAGLRWLQFDGGRELRIWADFIVNASPAASVEYYQKYAMNPNVHLLLGPSHAVLRPEFRSVMSSSPTSASKRILLMFGGGDDRGAIQIAIKALNAAIPKDVCFEIVAGQKNPNHDAHRELLALLPDGRANYHVDPSQLASLMSQCTLAVMAGGTATYEANMLGLPMVLVAIAKNQIAQALAWEEQGQAIYVGELEALEPQRLVAATQSFLEFERSPQRLVDGLGAVRVASALSKAVSEMGI